MKSNQIGMTFCNISDIKSFFEVIDNCKEPVYLKSDDGKKYDIRNEIKLRALIGCLASAPSGKISRLNVVCNCIEDAKNLMKYMMEARED